MLKYTFFLSAPQCAPQCAPFFFNVYGTFRVSRAHFSNFDHTFEKIKSSFDVILLITHRELVRDWADHIMVIKKENDVSSIVSY